MKKPTAGYCIEKANKDWLEAAAKAQGRSASNYLDRLLTFLRTGAQEAVDNQGE